MIRILEDAFDDTKNSIVEDVAYFIVDSSEFGNIGNIIDDEQVIEEVSNILGSENVYYVSQDSEGITKDIENAMLNLNDKNNCIWYKCFIKTVMNEDGKEVDVVECGDCDIVFISVGKHNLLCFKDEPSEVSNEIIENV